MGINGITAADGREIPGILPWNPSQIPFFSQGKFPNNSTSLEFRPGAPRSLQDSSQIPFFSQGKFPKFPGSVPSRRPPGKKFPGKVRRPGRSTRIPSEAGSTWTKASIFPKNPLGGNSSLGIPRSGSSERQRLRFGKNLGKPGISRLFFWEFCELWVLRFLFCPESWEIPSGCGVFLVDIQGKGRGIPGVDGGIPGWNFGMRIRTRRGPGFSLFALVPSLFPGNFGIFLWEFGAGSCYRLELEENREFSSQVSGIEVFGILP